MSIILILFYICLVKCNVNDAALPELYDETTNKYPLVSAYISYLRTQSMSSGGIYAEITMLNGCSQCDERYSTLERFGASVLASMSPFGPLGLLLGWEHTADKCNAKFREAEQRYNNFVSKF